LTIHRFEGTERGGEGKESRNSKVETEEEGERKVPRGKGGKGKGKAKKISAKTGPNKTSGTKYSIKKNSVRVEGGGKEEEEGGLRRKGHDSLAN